MIQWAIECPFWRMLCYIAIAGAIGYVIIRAHRRAPINTIAAGDAGGCAAAVYASLHLAYGAIYPACIIHLEDFAGHVFALSAIRVPPVDGPQPLLDFSIGEFHRFHIVIGGIISAVAAMGGYLRYCTEPEVVAEPAQHAQHVAPAEPVAPQQVPANVAARMRVSHGPHRQQKPKLKKKNKAKGKRKK
jgi:hypothetical protein